MKEILQFEKYEISPSRAEILSNQSIPLNSQLPPKTEKLIEQATDIFLDAAEPRGLIADISLHDFAIVYEGEGFNEDITPVQHIYPLADNLALFAVTVGEPVSERIDDLFERKEFAMASMLDSVASAGTDSISHLAERHLCAFLNEQKVRTAETGIMAYSPGYCGWHISGQKKLFEFLKPEEIGITLLESFLMKPLKSITGVIIAANKTVHVFTPRFPFCNECKSRSCVQRIKALFTDEEDACKGDT
jgi:hypothetical protein